MLVGMPPARETEHPRPDLDQLTEVDLLLRVARGWRRLGRGEVGGHGLSPHQERGLLTIARLTRGPTTPGIRVSQLAEHLGIAPRSATDVADALQDAGLLTRSPDPTDRRAVRLTLTGEGLHTVEQVRDRRRTGAEEAVAALSATDRAELRRLLRALVENQPGC